MYSSSRLKRIPAKPGAAPQKPVISRKTVPPKPPTKLWCGQPVSPDEPAVMQKMPGHIGLVARAGSGKTFSLIEGIKRQLGRPTPGIKGTEQQEAFWDELCRGPRPKKILFLAFNRSVKNHARNIIKRDGLQELVEVHTSHAFGLITCKKNRAAGEVERWKMPMILEQITGVDLREMSHEWPGFSQICANLCRLCKVSLRGVGLKDCPVATPEVLNDIISHFGINVPEDYVDAVFECVPEMLAKSVELADKMIDYEDMISLPIIKQLDIYKYDQVMVDEVQDLTSASRRLSFSAGKRVVICGDPAQAVYGFSGADCDSMNSYLAMLNSSMMGCAEFPLTQTRRCGRVIVELAQEIVPDIQPLDNAHEGEVFYGQEETYLENVEDSDMVICRTNAPLVSGVMRMLKQRRKAYIEGRDVGDDLENIIKRMKADNVVELAGKVDDWYMVEVNKLRQRKFTSEEAEIALADKRDCILALMDGCQTVKEVLKTIKEIFQQTTEDGVAPQGVRFSSIHRAKGLEAPTVHFLQHNKCPHPMATTDWQKVQEWNLRYVAITRAMNRLILIKSAVRERKEKEAE
jgi:DNA helicase II / ATP-dependent DNA helicase PcrA